MSHNITERDGVFTVREPAWHRLGEVLPDYPSREQAQKIAHPWEPVSEPVYRKVPSSQWNRPWSFSRQGIGGASKQAPP